MPKHKAPKDDFIRGKNGERFRWTSQLPSSLARETAKAGAREHPVAYCPCCNRQYLIPSVTKSVAEHGLCPTCRHLELGRSPDIAQFRETTLDEAFEAYSHKDARPEEMRVILKALEKAWKKDRKALKALLGETE